MPQDIDCRATEDNTELFVITNKGPTHVIPPTKLLEFATCGAFITDKMMGNREERKKAENEQVCCRQRAS